MNPGLDGTDSRAFLQLHLHGATTPLMAPRNVHLCYSAQAAAACDMLPSNRGRSSMVDSLIRAFGLHSKTTLVGVAPATARDLCVYHDSGYVAALLQRRGGTEREGKGKGCEENEENGNEGNEVDEEFPEDGHNDQHDDNQTQEDPEYAQDRSRQSRQYGLEYDCPPFPALAAYALCVAGSSLAAADVLVSRVSKNSDENQNVAVNWYGGRHHALKNSASGFCYVNDIVLAILRLRTRFRKVFYFDVDLHHGDGVESAFRFSKNVVTCSVHRHAVGFFPGSGGASGPGAYNIPTARGLSDASLKTLVMEVVVPLIAATEPDVIVLQCGSDGLAGDPSGEWNLTIEGLARALLYIVEQFSTTPFLVLGGGGYNHTETARFCAWFTKTLAGDTAEWDEIPEHEHLDEYEKDGFQFWTPENRKAKPGRRDENRGFASFEV